MLVPRQGAAGIWGPSCESCARLAVADLNAAAGLLGRPVELVAIDSGAPRAEIVKVLRSALAANPIRALVGMHPSDLRPFIAASIPSDLPYVFTPLYEGGETRPNVFAIGETPERLLLPGVAWLAEKRGAMRWFLVGHDYVWPRTMHAVARRLLSRVGGQVADDAYIPFGTDDFEGIFDRIRAGRPDVVVTSIVGNDAVTFHRAFAEAGFAADILRLSTAIEENVLYGVGAENTENMFLTSGYFAHIRSAGNDAFRERYHGRFGETPPMQNDLGQSCYEGLHYLAALADLAGSLSANAMRRRLPDLRRYRSARCVNQAGTWRRQVHLATVDGIDPHVVKSL